MPVGTIQNEADLERKIRQMLGSEKGLVPLHRIAGADTLASSEDAASVAADLATHEADTTGVHGIADTSALLTSADLAGLQPLDSDLTAIAALATTSFGRSFLELANAAAARTLIDAAQTSHTHAEADITGLVADLAAKQPLDSDLTSIAALATTSFGRSLLTQADAAATRTTIGAAATSHTHVAADTTDFNTAVRTNRLDQMATPTASVAMGTQKLTGLAAGSANGDSVRYEQGVKSGDTAGGDLSGTYPNPTIGAGKVVNASVSATAAIAYSKLALTGAILNADLAGSIAYSKLTLTTSIVNGDISASAAIAYSKLNLATSILNADMATTAAVEQRKLKNWDAPVTSLPASPVDGDMCVFDPSAWTVTGTAVSRADVQWLLRFRSSTGKWHLIGGDPLVVAVNTAETRAAAAAYAAITTAGPGVTVGIAGDYLVQCGSNIGGSAACVGFHSYDVGATGAVDADAAQVTQSTAAANNFSVVSCFRRKSGLAASDNILSKYKATTNTVTFQNRWISVLPIRLG